MAVIGCYLLRQAEIPDLSKLSTNFPSFRTGGQNGAIVIILCNVIFCQLSHFFLWRRLVCLRTKSEEITANQAFIWWVCMFGVGSVHGFWNNLSLVPVNTHANLLTWICHQPALQLWELVLRKSALCLETFRCVVINWYSSKERQVCKHSRRC